MPSASKSSRQQTYHTWEGAHDHPYRLDHIDPASQQVDESYQRGLNETKVEALASNWSDNAVGTIEISERADGSHYIIDGQHRVAAARLIGIRSLPAKIYTGLTLAEEAAAFVQSNTWRTSPLPLAIFRARLAAGDPTAHAILRVIEEAGYVLAPEYRSSRNPRHMRAITAVERIFTDVGATGLRFELDFIHIVWPDSARALDHTVLLGVHQFEIRYNLSAWREGDRERFQDKLAERGLDVLYRQALAYADIHGGTRAVNFGRAMLATYNERRSDRYKLDDRFAISASRAYLSGTSDGALHTTTDTVDEPEYVAETALGNAALAGSPLTLGTLAPMMPSRGTLTPGTPGRTRFPRREGTFHGGAGGTRTLNDMEIDTEDTVASDAETTERDEPPAAAPTEPIVHP